MNLKICESPSPNHDARPDGAPIDMLMLHYTGMRSAEEAIERLRDPTPPTGIPVASHYVVEEDGTTWRLVAEERRAWHAGISHWRGHARLGDRSIGVEIVNPGHEWGYRPFPPRQIDAVIALGRAIVARHPIPARNVVGHSDVAPDRKQDPGELFPWRALAAAGLGLWADAPNADGLTDGEPADPATLRAGLSELGYRVDDETHNLPVVLRAFRRHWRPEALASAAADGDAGDAALVAALLARI